MENILKPKKNIMTIITLSKVFRRKMNDIPEDLVEHIISFACDRRGYNTIEYHKRKKENFPRMKRILIEISDFFFYERMQNRPFSIVSLRPIKEQKKRFKIFKEKLKEGKASILYHTGFYLNYYEEEITVNGYNRIGYRFGIRL